MRLPYDYARCHGVRDGDTVRPHEQCQSCLRWQQADDYGPRTLHFIAPPGRIADGRLQCDQRIAQGA